MGRPWAAQGPLLLLAAQAVAAQQQECFTGGDIVGAVVGTVVALALLAAAAYFFWKYYWTRRQDGKTLTLVTNDPEAGLTDDHYAFDNPGFLTEDNSPQKKTPLKTSSNDGRSTIERNNINSDNKKGGKVQGKWQAWAPFSAFVGGSSGKGKHNSFKAMDDSFVGEPERDFVPLRGHDFTGLGFNICGNMREGIYVRDVLHRGPASESGRIAAGDRIVSISISLRHMVFEDALTILSYASPYDVQLEIEKRPHGRTIRESGSGKRSPSVGPPDRLCHPFYRSQSIDDLNKMRMSSMGARQAKLKKSENPASTTSVVSTMDRKETAKLEREAAPATKSNVSMQKPERSKKPTTSTTSLGSEKKPPTSAEKMAKFGVKVLPFNLTSELGQKLEPKAATEMSQNEQNKKIEEEEEEEEEVVHEMAVDVPDKMIQVVNEMKHKVEQEKHNIPTEMPEEMRLAAQAAVSHRKSLKEIPAMAAEDAEQQISIEENDRKKRRAPPPPVATAFSDMQLKFEENMSKAEEVLDAEQDKPVTIELGSSQVTIHQAGKEEQQPEVASPGKGRERKAASLGDLSRFDTDQPMSIPLERAVSLDMVDVNEVERKQQVAPVVSETAMTDTSIEEEDDDELTPTNTPLQRKEPLTVTDVLAGASDTFNRRLKKSSQWGTLEEALSIEKQHELKTVIAVDEESSGPASITYITPDDAPAAPPSPPTSPPPTVTFVSTASPTVQHVTEIQVLSMGDNAIDFPSSTTIRHGTSGGSLLVVQSREPPDEVPFTNNHHDGEADDNEKFESDTDVQVMATNVTVTPVNLEKEVMQISAAELDDIMMSHSSYLKTADNQFNTFEQWVFLEPPTSDENSKNEIIPPVVNHETNHKEFQSK